MLPFGITPVSEIFRKFKYNNMSDLSGVLNKTDDILVSGIWERQNYGRSQS